MRLILRLTLELFERHSMIDLYSSFKIAPRSAYYLEKLAQINNTTNNAKPALGAGPGAGFRRF
jgi:hypothetical protein